MKNKRKKLILILILVCICILYDGNTYAARADSYEFPDYVAVENKVWRAYWRDKRGNTYQNKLGAEKVTEDDLINLTSTNINLNCVKFTTEVVAVQSGGRYRARDPKTGHPVPNYCEKGYSVRFENGLASGTVVKGSDGKWKLQVCSYNSQNLESKIDELADPSNITMKLVDGKNYLVTFNAMNKYPGVFQVKNLQSSSYYDENGNKQYSFEQFKYNNSVIRNGNSLLIPAGTDFYVEFYVNEASPGCTEEFVAQIRSGAPKSITNPVLNYKNDNGQNICQTLKEKHGSTNNIVTGMVPYCLIDSVNYDEQIPTREEVMEQVRQVDLLLSGQNDIVKNKTAPIRLCNFLKSGANGIKNTTGTAEGIAAGNVYTTKIENKYLDSSKSLDYWRAVCTEEMTVMYDDPKAVNAGGGFSYTTIIQLTRTCSPLQIRTPYKKPKCEYSADCMGKGHDGGPGAGPTEEFDQCINTCDKGKYTQKCIDSCYSEVYGDTDVKTVSFSDQSNLGKLTYESKKGQNNIEKIRMTGSYSSKNCSLLGRTDLTPRPISSCYILGGNGGCEPLEPGKCPTCYTEHGAAVYYCDGCSGSNGHNRYSNDAVQCYEVFVSTKNCIPNPEEDYYKQVQQARNEYQALVAMMKEYTKQDYKDEKIYTGVYDNQLNKQVEFGENQQPLTDVSVTSTTSGDTNKTISTVTQTGEYAVTTDMLTYTWKQYTTTRKQTVHLTQSYVSNTANQSIGTGTIYQKKTMDCVRNDKNNLLCQKYYDGGYKYYTDLFTPTINDWRDWPYYNTNNNDYTIQTFHAKGQRYENIDVDLREFGSWQQWSLDIDCIYGLYQNFCPDCEPGKDIPPITIDKCDPNKDICSGGVQYIYREIHLDDEFPNDRDPRWNWTGTLTNRNENGQKLATGAARASAVSYRGYNIDPYALTAHIEKNGYKIYDVKTDSSEVDYEFTLTGRNLKNIRQYNKQVDDFNRDGEKNYLDYDTSCYTKTIEGKQIEVCTNNFLDNEQYITYSTPGFTQNERKAIAGCNNAKNGQCYDVSASN